MKPEQKPASIPGLPPGLLRRRRQQYRLRRRRYALSERPATPPTAEADAQAAPPEIESALREARENEELLHQEISVLKKRFSEIEARNGRLQKDVEALIRAREEAKKVVDQANERVQRNQSEMENMRKRQQREKEDLRKHASEAILGQLFTVLDHFAVAVDSLKTSQNRESIIQGVTMIFREFSDVLAQNGLTPVIPLGEPFDPKFHDAAATMADPSQPEGVILQVMRPGYVLKEKVLRPAMVAVNKLPDESQDDGDPEEVALKSDTNGAGPATKKASDPLEQAWKYLETRMDEKPRE